MSGPEAASYLYYRSPPQKYVDGKDENYFICVNLYGRNWEGSGILIMFSAPGEPPSEPAASTDDRHPSPLFYIDSFCSAGDGAAVTLGVTG